MNAVVQQQLGAISTRFANTPIEDDLGAGVQGGYGVIGYRGKVWSIRHNGDTHQLMRDDGDGPRNSIEVVVVKSPKVLSKVFYERGYEDGSAAAPDCFSTTGVAPDPGAVKKQATSCAACPHNAFGTGKEGRGKACSDSKRLAVTPLQDIPNEMFGGPMLLRVPAASLKAVADYGQKMAALGYPYYAVATRIAFDPEEAFPKFTFGAIRPLTDAEADQVLAMQSDPRVARILAEGADHAALAAPQQAAVNQAFEQPPVTPQVTEAARAGAKQEATKPAPKPATNAAAAKPSGFGATVATSKPATSSKPATAQAVQQPVQQPATQVSDDDFEKSLDEKLAALLPEVSP